MIFFSFIFFPFFFKMSAFIFHTQCGYSVFFFVFFTTWLVYRQMVKWREALDESMEVQFLFFFFICVFFFLFLSFAQLDATR